MDLTKIFERDNVSAKTIIRFHEKAMKSQRQMVSLEKEVSQISTGDIDPMNLLRSEFFEKLQQLDIHFYAAV